MWANAAKHMAKFAEGVINAVDAEGFPLSVRQTSLPYDKQSGEMPVTLPDALGAVEGPASLLCHFHDENLWGLRAILVKGKLTRREGKWIFVTTSFTPPSTWQMIKNVKKSARDYLAKRNMPWPVVNYAVIDEMWSETPRLAKR